MPLWNNSPESNQVHNISKLHQLYSLFHWLQHKEANTVPQTLITKPNILSKSDCSTIPNFPHITNFSSLNNPKNKVPKRRSSDLTTIKDILLVHSILIFDNLGAHNTSSFKWYMWIQEARRQKFELLKSGIPRPPYSFWAINCQLSNICVYLQYCSKKNLAICE